MTCVSAGHRIWRAGVAAQPDLCQPLDFNVKRSEEGVDNALVDVLQRLCSGVLDLAERRARSAPKPACRAERNAGMRDLDAAEVATHARLVGSGLSRAHRSDERAVLDHALDAFMQVEPVAVVQHMPDEFEDRLVPVLVLLGQVQIIDEEGTNVRGNPLDSDVRSVETPALVLERDLQSFLERLGARMSAQRYCRSDHLRHQGNKLSLPMHAPQPAASVSRTTFRAHSIILRKNTNAPYTSSRFVVFWTAAFRVAGYGITCSGSRPVRKSLTTDVFPHPADP
eukprot:3273286-Rhodomonas_salina.3